MKSNESKLRRCGAALLRQGHAAWTLLGKYVRRRPVGGEVMGNDLAEEQSDPPMSPLDRIEGYLHLHRLSPRVRVRFANDTGNFVLEDEDGVVHAKDYDEAVATIQRTWL
jgi:hypothetical protein